MHMLLGDSAELGLRERKRLETREKIAQNGLKLFLSNGFDQTTFDDIACAVNISRRTLFYYFETKEDILLASFDQAAQLLKDAVLHAPGNNPITVVKNAAFQLTETFQGDDFTAIDELVHSKGSLSAKRQAHYIKQESIVVAALSERFGLKFDQRQYQTVAMICMGIIRLSLEAWRLEGRQSPFTTVISAYFKIIQNDEIWALGD